jgi:NADH dehydrogenase
VTEHTIGFKSAQQCGAIHRRLERLARRRDGRVVVVGGGLEGIEALGEVLRRYRGRLHDVSIVEARERLVPGSVAAVHEHLHALCREHDVDVVTGDPVARVTAKTVFLVSGRRLRSDLTIWTGGPAAPALLSESGLAPPGSWAPVRETLEHRDYERVFVAGDAAELPSPLGKQAYHALDMGSCVAGNIGRAERGRPLRAFRPAPKPTLMTFGDLDTLLISDRITLAGPALAAGKEAVYAAVLAGLDRRPIPHRATAMLARGRRATQRLLWPALADLPGLRRRARLRRLA